MEMKLTDHFTLEEFTRSETAERLGIRNVPSEQAIANLKKLCQNVLEPLRTYSGCPVIVSSGYRCPELNAAVGGVSNSQHITGQAADIGISRKESRTLPDMAEFIRSRCDYDQLILEHTEKRDCFWLHVSYAEGKNRRQFFKAAVATEKHISGAELQQN